MFITSHLLTTVIVLGPSVPAVLGTIAPDLFDYINWVYHSSTGKINLKLLINNPTEFDKINDRGIIWEIDTACHSLLVFAIMLLLSSYSVFFLSYALHVGIDYLTHTRQPFYFLPFGKKGFNIGIVNFGSKNIRTLIIGDIILSAILMLKYGHDGFFVGTGDAGGSNFTFGKTSFYFPGAGEL